MTTVNQWASHLRLTTLSTIVTNDAAELVSLDEGLDRLRAEVKLGSPGTVYLIGNVAESLSVAAHIANYYALLGKPARAVIHTEEITLREIDVDDTLVAISCGRPAAYIIEAVALVRNTTASKIITFSGSDAENPMRVLGSLNFYVPDSNKSRVQLSHISILHAAIGDDDE